MQTSTSKLAAFLLAPALLAGGVPVWAQDGQESELEALRQEIKTLQAGQAAMRRQLTELKTLIQKGNQPARPAADPKPADVTMDLAGSPFQGNVDAPITVVEFSDYQ